MEEYVARKLIIAFEQQVYPSYMKLVFLDAV